MAAQFRIGTSGWSYKHWIERFYPKSLKPVQWLQFYAKHFDTVEINSTFYHLPKETAVKNWHDGTPQNFLFALKMSRFITHRKKLRNVEEPLENFSARIALLREKIGPILVQLPPTMLFDAELAESFFRLVTTRLPSYRFAVEPRHPSWFSGVALMVYQKYRIALCMADSGEHFPELQQLTSDFVYLRFHGRDGLYNSDYSREQLLPFAQNIRTWLQDGLDVYAYFNNDIEGFAIKNAMMLRELVAGAE